MPAGADSSPAADPHAWSPPRWTDRWSLAANGLAALTVVGGLAAMAAVERIQTTAETVQASADQIDETLAVTERLLTNLSDTMIVLQGTFDELDATAESSTAAIEAAADLAADVPNNLRDVQSGLEQTQSAAGAIDTVTRELSELPLVGGSVDPTELAPTISSLNSGLDPIVDNLEETAITLDRLADDGEALRAELPVLRDQLSVLADDLDDGAASIAGLRRDAAQVESSTVPWILLRLVIVLATLAMAGTNLVMARVLALR